MSVSTLTAADRSVTGAGLRPRRRGWFLIHDGRGQITSGLQLFGNVDFWNLLAKRLRCTVFTRRDNADGQLSGSELKGISLWQDLNSNGIADPGEVRPVTDYRVVAIDCGSQRHSTGIPFNPHGITFRDGTTRAHV